MTVVEATYRRLNATDQWYEVCIEETTVGEVWKTKKGWQGFCLNAKTRYLGLLKSKEELGQLIVAKWEAFPVAS